MRSAASRTTAGIAFAAAVLALAAAAPGAGPAPVPTTYSSGNLATAIPDAASFQSPITVPDVGEVLDVKVAVNAGHGQDDQLNFDLVHPDGTVVRLAHDHGGSGNNYGSGSDCSGGFAEFSDSAPIGIDAGAPPFVGSFRPEGSLAVLSGKSSVGIWKLVIADDTAGVIGTLWCWKLTITYALADLVLSTTATPETASVGGQLVYTHVVSNHGPNASRSTTLSDSLPDGAAFVTAQTTQGSCTGVVTVVCTLGALPAGASATVTIAVEPTKAGTLTNAATVVGTPDPPGATANNTTSTVTTVLGEAPGARGCTITGTSGDDVLAGTEGNDVICGLEGNDRIFAGGGNDVVYGDSGDDTVFGGPGDDRLEGGAGDDRLHGEEGADIILGGTGDDRVVGDEGNDRLTGGAGRDVLSGGDGNDVLFARDRARDVVKGGPGVDRATIDQKLDIRRSIEKLLQSGKKK